MTVQVTEISPVLVELQCEVPWERVQKSLELQINALQKRAHIKGFRPGKVPRNVVKQMFAARLRDEVTGQLVEEALLAAVSEHQLTPVASPSVDAKPFEEGSPLSFKAQLEVRPKVESVETSKLELTRPSVSVKDEEVTAELERLRESQADVRVPEPMRAAAAGDVLLIDYKVTVEGKDAPDLSADGRPAELGRGRLLKEFEEGLPGLNIGETRAVVVKFGDDHPREDLRGKEAIFNVTLKELRERVLPELDDEFAKDCGNFANLGELRQDIRNRLEASAKSRIDSDLREQLIDKLTESNPIVVPPTLVRSQAQAIEQEFAGFLRYTGQGQDGPLSDEVKASLSDRAERKVRAAILFGEVAKLQQIKVTPADLDARFAQIAERTGKHVAKVKADHKEREKRENLEYQVLEDKIVEYLLSQAKITEA